MKDKKEFEQLYQSALSIAQEAHKYQLDKGGAPYILHPIRVSMHCQSDEARLAALLHDVIEDSPYTLERLRSYRISEEVITAVDALTKRKDETYHEFITRLMSNPIAREVKIADLEDNMDITRLPELTDKDVERLRKYLFYWQMLKA